jgi:hypothetical protein
MNFYSCSTSSIGQSLSGAQYSLFIVSLLEFKLESALPKGVGDLATMQKWREQFNLLTDQTLSTLGS